MVRLSLHSFLALCSLGLIICCDGPKPGSEQPPSTTLYDPASLLYAREACEQGRAPYAEAVDSLLAAAETLLYMEAPTVIE